MTSTIIRYNVVTQTIEDSTEEISDEWGCDLEHGADRLFQRTDILKNGSELGIADDIREVTGWMLENGRLAFQCWNENGDKIIIMRYMDLDFWSKPWYEMKIKVYEHKSKNEWFMTFTKADISLAFKTENRDVAETDAKDIRAYHEAENAWLENFYNSNIGARWEMIDPEDVPTRLINRLV